MANRKREAPLTEEQRKARNRLYQHRRRHVDNNAYARAQRRAMQRAVQWFKENKEGTWHRWLNEELRNEREDPNAAAYSANGKSGHIHCKHDAGRTIIGFTVACDLCGKAVGSVSITENDRVDLNDKYQV